MSHIILFSYICSCITGSKSAFKNPLHNEILCANPRKDFIRPTDLKKFEILWLKLSDTKKQDISNMFRRNNIKNRWQVKIFFIT